MAIPEEACDATANQGAAGGRSENGRPGGQRRLRLLLRVLLIAAFVLVLVRIFVLEPYSIPTGSMRPTILEGDVLLVNKLPYTIRSIEHFPFTRMPIPHVEIPGFGRLERGDIVVFAYPSYAGGTMEDDERQFVKRCAAIMGDTIQLLDGRIRVNGREVPGVPDEGDDELRRRTPVRNNRVTPLLRSEEPVIVPYAGYELQLDSATAANWRSLIESEGTRVEYRNRIVFLNGIPALNYTFHRDYFFALGDNSGISRDSRFFGFIPFENLIGQAWMIYWSREPDGKIRWDRIGTIIR